MNRLVSLLLVALSLAAVGLARPAQAQWTMGKPYYDSQNGTPTQYGNTVIETMNPIGTVTISSNPPSYPYTAGGGFSGNVKVDYTWTGSPTTQTGFGGTGSFSAGGSTAGIGAGSANSSASVPYEASASGTTANAPNHAYSFTSSHGYSVAIDPNSPPTKVTRSASLTAYTSAQYSGPVTASASVTLGAPAAP